eukprot:c7037_g1_i1 orf=145-906(+)
MHGRSGLLLLLAPAAAAACLSASCTSVSLYHGNAGTERIRSASCLYVVKSSFAIPEHRISRNRMRVDASSRAETEVRGGEGEKVSATRDDRTTLERAGTGTPSTSGALEKEIEKVVRKTASTFAPRASVVTKNPAVPGTVLYSIFQVQGYLSMALGGALSFNLLFPSNEPDIWRLLGMWSVWMFTIPSLRARDCPRNEKDALNYLFLIIPLLNLLLPMLWKSFAVVWSADVLAFFVMYAWKLDWLSINKQDAE